MSDKRRGLGRGLGALIPSGGAAAGSRTGAGTGTVPPAMRPAARPIDVFFDQRPEDDAVAVEHEERLGDVAVVTTEDTPPAEKRPQKPQKAASASRKAAGSAGADGGVATPETALPGFSSGDAAVAEVGEAEIEPEGPGLVVEATAEPVAAESSSGADLVEVPGARFAEVPVSAITPNPRQPRTVFDEDDLAELVHSVREIGVLQPIVVRPIEPADDGSARFELVMGERRWRATTEAGLETIPAIVRDTADDDLLRDALLENLHRSQLNPLEEAAAYQQLLDDFGCTHEELATRIGRSRPQISNTLRLMKLPPLVQRRVAAGVISAGHARALLSLEDGAAMERLAQRVVAEGLSVRAVEEMIALGDADTAPRRRNPAQPKPELESRASTLADRLDTRVKISMGRTRGRLTVDFAGMEDLDRILRLLEASPSA